MHFHDVSKIDVNRTHLATPPTIQEGRNIDYSSSWRQLEEPWPDYYKESTTSPEVMHQPSTSGSMIMRQDGRSYHLRSQHRVTSDIRTPDKMPHPEPVSGIQTVFAGSAEGFHPQVVNNPDDLSEEPTSVRGISKASRGEYKDIAAIGATSKRNQKCLVALAVWVSLLLVALVVIVTLVVLGPCARISCIHGSCDYTRATMRSPVCQCEDRWAGPYCDKEVVVVLNGSNLEISWDLIAQESDRSWSLVYSEIAGFPDVLSRYTEANKTTFDHVKPLETYILTVFSVDWDHVMTEIDTQTSRVGRNQDVITFTWTSSPTALRGYFVTASRVRKALSNSVILDKDVQQVTLRDLDACTSYNILTYEFTSNLDQELVFKMTQETECSVEEVGWKVGHSVIVNGWSGGAYRTLWITHCNQPDAFPLPVVSPSCTGSGEATGNVGEAITDDISHSGTQSWHYKRGHARNSHGSGCPYSPELSLKAGRSDGGYLGDVDGFRARVWFKAANQSGDGSSIEIAGGDSKGDDRVSTMTYITATPQGIEMHTYDCHWDRCMSAKNCSADYFSVPLAENLTLGEWHLLEFELRAINSNYSDRWIYTIDGNRMAEVGAYLNAWTMENLGVYKYINRLKFKPRNDDIKDVTKLGFYFDDIGYDAFTWGEPELVLDKFATSFEL